MKNPMTLMTVEGRLGEQYVLVDRRSCFRPRLERSPRPRVPDGGARRDSHAGSQLGRAKVEDSPMGKLEQLVHALTPQRGTNFKFTQ